MQKNDLKTGMRVRMRSGKLFLVLRDCDTLYDGHQDIVFVSFDKNYGCSVGDDYSDDMLYHPSDCPDCSNWDICEVYTTVFECVGRQTLNKQDLKLIWKRNSINSNLQKELLLLGELKEIVNNVTKILSEINLPRINVCNSKLYDTFKILDLLYNLKLKEDVNNEKSNTTECL